ncbi:hypothetical protein AA313_de0204943 [Arthrobotrys entomopaga]|nr:hypothetical protein AA313_de0204943 [Arthrobotrys entomopaga]
MSAITPDQNPEDFPGNRDIFEDSFHAPHMLTIIKAYTKCKKLEIWSEKARKNIKDTAERLEKIKEELNFFLSEPHNLQLEDYREAWEEEIEKLGAKAKKMQTMLYKELGQPYYLWIKAKEIEEAHKEKIAIICEELPKFFWKTGEPLKVALRFSKYVEFLLDAIPDIIGDRSYMVVQTQVVLQSVASCREALLDVVNK